MFRDGIVLQNGERSKRSETIASYRKVSFNVTYTNTITKIQAFLVLKFASARNNGSGPSAERERTIGQGCKTDIAVDFYRFLLHKTLTVVVAMTVPRRHCTERRRVAQVIQDHCVASRGLFRDTTKSPEKVRLTQLTAVIQVRSSSSRASATTAL